jgi:multidrug efflux pump subunit AcrA (membrane-fusion protein)
MAKTPPDRRDLDESRGFTGLLTAVATRALALQEAALALGSSEDVEVMAAKFLPIVSAALGAREAALLLVSGEDQFQFMGGHGIPTDLVNPMQESLLEQAAASVASSSPRPIARDAILEDEAYVAWCEEQELPEGEARRPYFELYTPLRAQETTVAVLALGRRADGNDYDEDDLLSVEHIGSSAAVAVRRCLLARDNEHKLDLLRALSKFSGEITSTLDLNRVLLTVVNTTEAVLGRDRACVALVEGGALKIRAVSDKVTVEVNEAEVLGMVDMLAVLYRHRARLRVAANSMTEDSDLPGQDVFTRYFEAGEMQSLLALPLQDEEGLLGYLVLESRDPDGFADESAEEALGILSGAVTVAIRNADLYRRVPMVGLLGPLAAQRRRFAEMNPARRAVLLAGVGAALLLTAVVPWSRKVAGPALVRPSEVLPVSVLAPGVVDQIYVRSGGRVVEGMPVAAIRNRETDARLAAARADLAIAQRRAAEAAEQRDPSEAQRWMLQAQNLSGWLAYAQSQGADLRLISPVTGSVLTPQLEERVGEVLDRGDVLCEVARLDPVRVDVEISEEEVGTVTMGGMGRIKVLAYPAVQFRGKIVAIAPEGEAPPGKPAMFRVTVECPNKDLRLLAGMTGRAKLDAGRSPLLLNVIRPLVRAIRMNFWI